MSTIFVILNFLVSTRYNNAIIHPRSLLGYSKKMFNRKIIIFIYQTRPHGNLLLYKQTWSSQQVRNSRRRNVKKSLHSRRRSIRGWKGREIRRIPSQCDERVEAKTWKVFLIFTSEVVAHRTEVRSDKNIICRRETLQWKFKLKVLNFNLWGLKLMWQNFSD